MSTARAKRPVGQASNKAGGAAKAGSSGSDRLARLEPSVAAFIRKHWPSKGRAGRIARAEKAWREAAEIASSFKKIDDETWKWIAQSKELEDS